MKRTRKILALLLIASMAFSVFHPIGVYAVTQEIEKIVEENIQQITNNVQQSQGETQQTATGNTTEFAGGEGTEESPYLIANKTHLNNVRNYLGAQFKLVCDIEFEEADFTEGGAFYNDGAGFMPIGSGNASAFTGVFDGNGYTVKNLYINITSDTTVYAGLFGYNQGTIKNLGVAGGNITASSTSTDANTYAYAGGIAGLNSGTIENCYNTGTVSATSTDAYAYAYAGGITGRNYNGTITNCYNTGAVSATSTTSTSTSYADAGGIAGGNAGTIENCYNTGTVSATTSTSTSSSYVYAGGIAGGNAGIGTIENCYNTGTVSATSSSSYAYACADAGGIAGENYGSITNCYNTGTVSTTSSLYAYAGGIAGYNYRTISNCYYADITEKGVCGGNDTATKCTMEELTQQSTFVGFDFEAVWEFDETLESHKTPVLKNIKHIEKETEGNTTEFAGGEGTEESPYLIANKTHLNNVRNYLDAHYKLLCDIEFEEADFAEGGAFYNDGAGFMPIGSGNASAFTGVFDGNGYTVKNLYINIASDSTVYVGLFGYNKGIIKKTWCYRWKYNHSLIFILCRCLCRRDCGIQLF